MLARRIKRPKLNRGGSNPRQFGLYLVAAMESAKCPLPHWFKNEEPLQSAVRYLGKRSGKYSWCGIYVLKGNVLELGPFVGAETEHRQIAVGNGVCGTAVAENRDINVPDVRAVSNYIACSLTTRSELVVLIRNKAGKVLGQIDIDSDLPNAFDTEDEREVRAVAEILGELWNGSESLK